MWRVLHSAAQGMAWIVLFLAGDFSLYLLATRCQATASDLIDPLLNMIMPTELVASGASGFPLAFYGPIAAFGVFAL